jgi:hypothetical protein
MKFAAILATISAVQVSAIEAGLDAEAPVCNLKETPRCGDDTKWLCMSSAAGAFMTSNTDKTKNVAITLDFSPTVSVCQPVTAGETKAVDYTLSMKVEGAEIATGLFLAKDFTAVSGAQALVATAAAALSAVYMM